jgi:hypothetical protein
LLAVENRVVAEHKAPRALRFDRAGVWFRILVFDFDAIE